MSSEASASVHSPPAVGLENVVIDQGRYSLRFVTRPEELEAILRLRFRIFNLELGEGLASSFETGRDEDRFDAVCDHLYVFDRRSDAVIGTYRLQDSAIAETGHGFYSAAEFTLESLPVEMLQDSIELGRACIAREHRNRRVLFLLWRGLATYMSRLDKRWLFGCCSLTSQDPCQGAKLYRQLEQQGRLHPELRVEPRAGFECVCPDGDLENIGTVEVPTLFATYLRFGGQLCGPPAIDREFKTIDFLLVMDVESLDPATYRLFFD